MSQWFRVICPNPCMKIPVASKSKPPTPILIVVTIIGDKPLRWLIRLPSREEIEMAATPVMATVKPIICEVGKLTG